LAGKVPSAGIVVSGRFAHLSLRVAQERKLRREHQETRVARMGIWTEASKAGNREEASERGNEHAISGGCALSWGRGKANGLDNDP
jgi:hypothetical protein